LGKSLLQVATIAAHQANASFLVISGSGFDRENTIACFAIFSTSVA